MQLNKSPREGWIPLSCLDFSTPLFSHRRGVARGVQIGWAARAECSFRLESWRAYAPYRGYSATDCWTSSRVHSRVWTDALRRRLLLPTRTVFLTWIWFFLWGLVDSGVGKGVGFGSNLCRIDMSWEWILDLIDGLCELGWWGIVIKGRPRNGEETNVNEWAVVWMDPRLDWRWGSHVARLRAFYVSSTR